MDWLRSCYTTEMRFFSDDERTTLVDWYFVDDNTPFIPFTTPFRSRGWDQREEGWNDWLGEVYGAPRTWRNGSKVGTAKGSNTCGTAGQWRDGEASPPDPPVELDDAGTPLCCQRVPPPPPPADECTELPTGQTPDVVNVDLSAVGDGTCACAPFRSTGGIARVGGLQTPCLWEGVFLWDCPPFARVLVGFQVQPFATPYLELDFLDAQGVSLDSVIYTGNAGWDGLTPTTLALFLGGDQLSDACSWPATVTVTPLANP